MLLLIKKSFFSYEERNKFRPYKATTSSPNRQNIEIQILHFFY